jgi:hypothetical protein
MPHLFLRSNNPGPPAVHIEICAQGNKTSSILFASILASGLPDLQSQVATQWWRNPAAWNRRPLKVITCFPWSRQDRCAAESSLQDSLDDRCQFMACANGKCPEDFAIGDNSAGL